MEQFLQVHLHFSACWSATAASYWLSGCVILIAATTWCFLFDFQPQDNRSKAYTVMLAQVSNIGALRFQVSRMSI
jgi:hypothetical protein